MCERGVRVLEAISAAKPVLFCSSSTFIESLFPFFSSLLLLLLLSLLLLLLFVTLLCSLFFSLISPDVLAVVIVAVTAAAAAASFRFSFFSFLSFFSFFSFFSLLEVTERDLDGLTPSSLCRRTCLWNSENTKKQTNNGLDRCWTEAKERNTKGEKQDRKTT